MAFRPGQDISPPFRRQQHATLRQRNIAIIAAKYARNNTRIYSLGHAIFSLYARMGIRDD